MKKVQIHQFDPVIYPYKIWVMVTNNLNVVEENFTERNGASIAFVRDSNYEAMVLDIRKKSDTHNDIGKGLFGALIIFNKKSYMTIKNICHESSHAAKRLFEHIGADVNEHEPFEYVVGWIADCIEQVKKNKFK